ncbi:MAG: hypothetical protein WC955_08770 [Elusimicrobiota bacterium]
MDNNVIELGNRLELFIDNFIVENHNGTALKLHTPVVKEKVVEFNSPWDGPHSTYVTIFEDKPAGVYRMYYRGGPLDIKALEGTTYAKFYQGVPDRQRSIEVTCYAESKDGIHWVKPNLGLFEFEGSKNNNIVYMGQPSTNFVPFIDTNPVVKDGQRYKAVAGGRGLYAYCSSDGLNWERIWPEPVVLLRLEKLGFIPDKKCGGFDSQNVAFYDSTRGCYVCYYRVNIDGFRYIVRSMSSDFLNWSDPVMLDYGDTEKEQFYTNAITPYPRAPHILLAFPKRFHSTRKYVTEHKVVGVSDGVFMSSRDGVRFDRGFMEAFFRPGRDRSNWTDRNNMAAFGVLQLQPDEVSVFYTQHYRHATNCLVRTTVRADGFVSVNAPHAGGELVTKPLKFTGDKLVINYATSAVGYIKIELQDENGNAIPNYTLDDATELYGDDIECVYTWKSGSSVAVLAGKPVRLRIVMKDADLYSIRLS